MLALAKRERARIYQLTFEHVFPLTVEDTCAGLQILTPQEVGEGDGDGVRRAREDGLGLALLVRVLVIVTMTVAALSLLALHLFHVGLLLLHGLPLEMLDELGNCHAGLLGVDCDLALHGSDLLGRGHLPGHWSTLHGWQWFLMSTRCKVQCRK